MDIKKNIEVKEKEDNSKNINTLYAYIFAWRHLIEGKKINFLRNAIKNFELDEDYESCIGVQKAIKEYKYYIDIMKKLKKRNIASD